MAKEKVTLTLDAGQLAELRRLVGARSLSATVDAAVGTHLARLRHAAALDEWLADLERQHGPVPPEDQAWAANVVGTWLEGKKGQDLRAG